ncbi:hypothetical protein AYI69_g10641, partial [Smittium culicis]
MSSPQSDQVLQSFVAQASKDDFIFEKDAVQIADAYISNGGTPFNVLRTFVESFKGYPKTANSISSDFDSSFKTPSSTYLSNAIKTALLECVSEDQ